MTAEHREDSQQPQLSYEEWKKLADEYMSNSQTDLHKEAELVLLGQSVFFRTLDEIFPTNQNNPFDSNTERQNMQVSLLNTVNPIPDDSSALLDFYESVTLEKSINNAGLWSDVSFGGGAEFIRLWPEENNSEFHFDTVFRTVRAYEQSEIVDIQYPLAKLANFQVIELANWVAQEALKEGQTIQPTSH